MMARFGTIGISLLLLAAPAFAQNPYYDHGTFPSGGSLGSSAAMRAELDLIEAGFAKLPTIAGNANKVVIVNSGATALTATDAPIPSGAAFPSSPGINALFFITDDTSPGSCDSNGGTSVTLCRWDGEMWVAVLGAGGGSVSTLDQAFDGGPEIDNATSANPLIVGNGTQKGKLYGDATKGFVIEPVPIGDSVWRIWTNFNGVIRDEEGAATVLTIDPDAASKNAMYQFGTNYKPLASIPVTLFPGGAASYSEASIVTNQPKSGWIQITDADTDYVGFRTVVTGKMVGVTTATMRLYGVSDNASPSGNIVLTCAIRSNRPGTDTYAGMTFSSGNPSITLTPATQNRPVSAVSSAVTISGTVAVFAELEGACHVHSASTTSAQLTDFFLRAEGLLQLSVNSWSD